MGYLRVLGFTPEYVGAGLANLPLANSVRERLEHRAMNPTNTATLVLFLDT